MLLMAGARSEDERIRYPVSELAAPYRASVAEETSNPDEAYADSEPRVASDRRTGTSFPGPRREGGRRDGPDDSLSWVRTSLYEAELALHKGDAAPRRALWSLNEPARCSVHGATPSGTTS